MNQFLFNFLAEVTNFNPSYDKLDDIGVTYTFTWVIACIFIALTLAVTFKTSSRTNPE